ncbi:MAG: coenzyme F420-reducing hydrogenase, beta subunit [Ilumatobacteraceae bacterium]|nr:coenzyme F420-reducing hydrogenase, beta subunit [Ilumatobacteraceae bacterium]
MEFDTHGFLRPSAPRSWLRHRSTGFARTCPFSPGAADEDALAADLFPDAIRRSTGTGSFIDAYVGHAAAAPFRAQGSSGGMVSWVLAELLRLDRIDGVAHVVASRDPQQDGRFFRYRVSRTIEEVHEGAKSRYYPIELSDVLREIRDVPGRYAVVGVPCFIKAVQLLRREDPVLRERIVCTLGLFCGHMKSARFIESFAWQLGVEIADVQAVEFRQKDVTRPASTYTARLQLTDGSSVQRDWWNLADGDWGAGFFQSPACNACDDVVGETADISFGDAWVEPYSSDGNGTNVVVIRSSELAVLVSAGIADGRLALQPVDAEFIEQTQAAGLRQRREGLGYRLTWHGRNWHRLPLTPRKRVVADAHIPLRRKAIYRIRAGTSAWSHRVFWVARRTGHPQLYVRWAAATQSFYHAFSYSRGRLGAVVDRLLPKP